MGSVATSKNKARFQQTKANRGDQRLELVDSPRPKRLGVSLSLQNYEDKRPGKEGCAMGQGSKYRQ